VFICLKWTSGDFCGLGLSALSGPLETAVDWVYLPRGDSGDSCGCSSGQSDSIRGGKFLSLLINCQLLVKDLTLLSWFKSDANNSICC
jgi:hypothetical protein